jgi:hypothetical protein
MIIHRTIPYSVDALIALAGQCLQEVTNHGASLTIKQNDAEAVAADLFDLAGNPGSGSATPGKRALLNQLRQAVVPAQVARREAWQAGRDFNARAIDYLKLHLGRKWNPQWTAVGLNKGSLRLPYDPRGLLRAIRAYFQNNPTHEMPALGLTAAEAHARSQQIDATLVAEAQAMHARDVAKRQYMKAVEALRKRIVGLRYELRQKLSSEDMRWRAFGFARPVDSRIPEKVERLTLKPSATPGELIAKWPAAKRADSYRVTRQVEGVDESSVEVGIITGTMCLIQNLPTGSPVTISITARNPAGETLPFSRTITVT